MVEKHLLPNEEVLADLKRSDAGLWDWYCTNQRVLRHRPPGDEKIETVKDVSFQEITSIYYGVEIDEGTDNTWLGILLSLLGLGGLAGVTQGGETGEILGGIGLLLLVLGILAFLSGTSDTEEPKMQLRGPGYLDENYWTLSLSPGGREVELDKDEVREFAMVVRDQLH